VSHAGYIKRLAVSAYRRPAPRRQGRHRRALPRKTYWVEHLFIAFDPTTNLMFFHRTGKCYWLKGNEIPQAARGRPRQAPSSTASR